MLQRPILATLGVLLQIWIATGQPTITPDKNPVRVLAPGTINLTCKVKRETDIVWEHGGNRITEGGKYNISILKKSVGGGMESTSTLRVVNPTSDDEGQYSCYDENSPGEKETKIVKVLQVETTNANLTIGGSAILRCEPQNLDPAEISELHFKWTYNGQNLENPRATEHKENYTLEFNNLEPKDAGQYECNFNFKEVMTFTHLVQPVNLNAPPFVEKFEKSKNMVQGDKLKLKCVVHGHPMPEVVWKRDDQEIDYDSDKRISVEDLEKDGVIISKNGILTIFELQFEDRAVYKCEANNTFGTDNSTILVRVKDKLAALWPFLGIVAEVAILCLIIFIYEKKRSKESDDEEDAPLQKTANAQDHKGKDEVRQRKP
ncbi:basigin-like [Liolophura sinensis]|uniref:basigin-like n=1 Tax=Liolophura sinensis TaxID=3198878 RepID=UPI003158CFE9